MSTALKVPLLDLHAQYAPLRTEILQAVTRVCDSQQFILGPEIAALERELAERLEVRETIAVSSGTDAILAVLMALGVGAGDEVITSTYSFFATAGCIARLGATPVLADIDPVTFNIDPASVRALMTPRTRAILPVHLFGLCADLDPMLETARAAGVPVVEDACQAIGARYNGKQAGGLGAAGCFSFFPSKNLGAFGDGGLISTDDASLAHELRLLRNHGAEPKYFHKRVGGNFRLDALQAAVLRVKLPHLEAWTEMRRRNASRYHDLFVQAGLTAEVVLPVERAGSRHIFNQYVIRIPRRDAVRRRLEQDGIGTEVYYPVPFHRQECFASLRHTPRSFPHADHAAETSLALPIYGELTRDQQAAVVRAIGAALGR